MTPFIVPSWKRGWKSLAGLWLWLALNLIPRAGWAALSGGDALAEPIGARQTGMGETYAAFSHDLYSLHYNVAGLADLSRPALGSMYTSNVFENQNAFLIAALPVSWAQGAFGVSLLSVTGPMMDLITLDGASQSLRSQQDFVATAGYAQQVAPALSAGASVKIFHSTLLEEYQATAYACDLGVQAQDVGWPGVRVGASLQNLGTEIKYLETGDPLPTTLRVGAGYQAEVSPGHALQAGVDVLFPNDNNLYQHLGVEYLWNATIALRAGYQVGYDLAPFTFGAGLRIYGFQIDYAFKQNNLGDSAHHIGLGYEFGAVQTQGEPVSTP